MRTEYEIKRLRALLEGLECQGIDDLIADATPETLRAIGAEIAKSAKLGAPFYRRGMGEPILCDNAEGDSPSPDQ